MAAFISLIDGVASGAAAPRPVHDRTVAATFPKKLCGGATDGGATTTRYAKRTAAGSTGDSGAPGRYGALSGSSINISPSHNSFVVLTLRMSRAPSLRRMPDACAAESPAARHAPSTIWTEHWRRDTPVSLDAISKSSLSLASLCDRLPKTRACAWSSWRSSLR